MAREKASLGHRKLPAGRSRDVGFSRCAAYVSDGDAPSDDPASDGSESDFAAEAKGVAVPLAKQPKGSRVVKKTCSFHWPQQEEKEGCLPSSY
ncbi:hypothetical protein VPH35_083125 [Triticum aestivum]